MIKPRRAKKRNATTTVFEVVQFEEKTKAIPMLIKPSSHFEQAKSALQHLEDGEIIHREKDKQRSKARGSKETQDEKKDLTPKPVLNMYLKRFRC